MIEFSLRPAEFARIGSSPAVEITLPMVGIKEQECRLSLDDDGHLWLYPAGEEDAISMEPPSSFLVGPYHFSITKEEREHAPAALPVVPAAPLTVPFALPESMAARRKITIATVAALVTGGICWWAFRPTDAPPEKKSLAAAAAGTRIVAVPAIEAEPVTQPKPEPAPVPATPLPESMDLEKLARRVRPCVFLLQVRDEQDAIVSTGTGFAISADGMVATNHHVIKKGGKLEALTEQGAKFSVARVLIEDAEADLAILQLEAKDLSFLPLGNSAAIATGKRVAVYGSPVGLAGTLSEGIISALRRQPGEGFPNNGELLQTTAPVSPGSSGSPLLDAEGNVLGVITLASGGRIQNLNFAVPVVALHGLKERAAVLALVPEPAPREASAKEKPHPATPDALYFNDQLYVQLKAGMDAKDWIPSLKLARQLVKKYPDAAASHFHFALCADMLRLDQEAEAAYEKSLAIQPDQHASWNNLGNMLMRRDEIQRALSSFERAALASPDQSTPWDNIVRCSILLKDWERAASALETLVKLDDWTAWKWAERLTQARIPDATLQRAVQAVIAHKEDNSLYAEANPRPNRLEYFIIGVPEGDTLSVRSGPGMNFARVASLANGVTDVTVTGKPRMNGSTEWVPIEANGTAGWVRSKYLRPMPPK